MVACALICEELIRSYNCEVCEGKTREIEQLHLSREKTR